MPSNDQLAAKPRCLYPLPDGRRCCECDACQDPSAACVCGEINTRHCPVHGQGESAATTEGGTVPNEPHVCRPEQTDEQTATCPVCHAVYTLDEEATADERSYVDA